MRRMGSLLLLIILVAGFIAGCDSKKENVGLNSKHNPLPDYVLNSSAKVQETYIMASNNVKVLAQVPCYCGCGTQDGHESNLDCYVDKLGSNNAVEEWDPMSIS